MGPEFGVFWRSLRRARVEYVTDRGFAFQGMRIPMHGEEPIASALLRAGVLTLRRTRGGAPRGVFCGIGVCNDCLVRVDGRPNQRSCLVVAEPGMQVELG